MRDLVERIPDPPQSPDFFEQFWRRAEVLDRAAARRWRRIAIATAALASSVAIVGVVVAATRASTTVVDTTVRCALGDRGGVPFFSVYAAPATRLSSQNGAAEPAVFGVETAQSDYLVSVDHRFKGYQLDKQSCHSAPKIPLVSRGLPSKPQVFRAGGALGFRLECTVGHLLFRARITQNSSGMVTAVELAVRAKAAEKPVAFVDWTPAKVVAYSVQPSACAAY